MRRTLCALLLLTLFAPTALGQPKTEPAPQTVDAGSSVYQKVVRSTVWVHSDRGGGKLATGTGSLVDKGRRLVLTNYHVVGDVKAATVYFPEFEGREGKKTISERKYYTDRAGKLGITGEVLELDKQADLALIRIDRVPDGATELPLAPESPDPGQSVHSIGNPGKSGALWVYTPGKVRQVYSKKWKVKLDERTTVSFEAKVIETDSPTNPGDSGGPLVNDKGELVGVTQGGALDAQSISIFVDLSEVKRLVNRRSVQLLRAGAAPATQPKDPPKAPREKALESKDDGKFFGETAWKRVAPTAEKLLKEKNTDFVVETFMTPPKGDADKIAALKPAEREKFFKEMVDARAKELKLHGVYVLVSKKPATLYIEVSKDLPADLGPKLKSALLASFKENKFDEGLAKVIDMTLEAKGLGEKK
ncbi:trypsin-like peptidase domain-containing protein [Gemmata sp. G18]|uniref:Trypsin-like peptidase domain-containing protein n=1 Tax=Gemmata palustris TaxID=2822762 RepID=A0ABS5C3S4_9BACT|nr:serine protease [Gemmata palustris]MBP3960647.1 trypsin-like peptidase domain-containing protein [Gemmata palustris]